MDVVRMERKTNKTIIFGTIIVIILIVVGFSAFQINKTHQEKLYSVMQNKIIGQALRCYNEDKCNDTTISLKDLYDKQYLETVINPVNSEYVNENSYVEILGLDEGKLTIIE